MSLSKADKKEIVGIFTELLKVTHPTNIKETHADVKISTKPKRVISAKERPELLKKLTIKQRCEYWGDLNKDNIFKNRYKCAHSLYKGENIEGRPNIRYSEAYGQFIVPIARNLKYTVKQMQQIHEGALKVLNDKIQTQENMKAKEWLQKSLEEIKGMR